MKTKIIAILQFLNLLKLSYFLRAESAKFMQNYVRYYFTAILLVFSCTLVANNLSTESLESEARQFLSSFESVDIDIAQLNELEATSQQLIKKLQSCEQQAESNLSQLTQIREIEVLSSGDNDGASDINGDLPSNAATNEVDRQINETSKRLITCRLKSSQVSEARLELLSKKQNIWITELTKSSQVWSFSKDQFTLQTLSDIVPTSKEYLILTLLVLAFYLFSHWRFKDKIHQFHEQDDAHVNLKPTLLMLLSLFSMPLILAWCYFYLAETNQWHLLILVGGLLVRDSCVLLSIRALITDEKSSVMKNFMLSSGILLVLLSFGFNGIYFKDYNQNQWLENYALLFTPLVLLMGLLLIITNWHFYQLIKNYRDRYVPALLLILSILSTLAYAFTYANAALYALTIIAGGVLVHWFLKSINWLRKMVLRKKLVQLNQDEKNAETTFTFPFWVSLITAIIAGGIGLIFLGWLAGISEEAFKQLSFIFTEGFDIGSVRLVPKDVLVGVVILSVLIMLLGVVRQGIQNKWFDKSRLRKSSREVFSMIVWYIGITIAVFVGLTVAGFDISNLAIIAGALSVGIGFGLQNIVSNFVSGLILLFERPVTRGDWVEVGDTVGLIEKVKIRATRIRTFDNAEILVPNSELLSHHVTNWTLSNSIGRIKLKVGVAYGTDVGLVRDILNEIATNHNQVMQREPYKHKVLFREFGDSSLNFELRVMIKDIKQFLDVESELNFAIDSALREAGVTIPFPQRDLHIIDAGTIPVKTTAEADETEDIAAADEDDKLSNSEKSSNNSSPSGQGSDSGSQENDVEKMIEEDEKRKEAEKKAAQKEQNEDMNG